MIFDGTAKQHTSMISEDKETTRKLNVKLKNEKKALNQQITNLVSSDNELEEEDEREIFDSAVLLMKLQSEKNLQCGFVIEQSQGSFGSSGSNMSSRCISPIDASYQQTKSEVDPMNHQYEKETAVDMERDGSNKENEEETQDRDSEIEVISNSSQLSMSDECEGGDSNEDIDEHPNSPTNTTGERERGEKRKRQRTSPQQLDLLEKIFINDKMPNQKTRNELAAQLGMSARRIQVWFQNKRAKLKRVPSTNNLFSSSVITTSTSTPTSTTTTPTSTEKTLTFSTVSPTPINPTSLPSISNLVSLTQPQQQEEKFNFITSPISKPKAKYLKTESDQPLPQSPPSSPPVSSPSPSPTSSSAPALTSTLTPRSNTFIMESPKFHFNSISTPNSNLTSTSTSTGTETNHNVTSGISGFSPIPITSTYM